MLTNLVSLLQATPAYQAAALPLMLSNMNLYAERLSLPVPHPIEPPQLVERYVAPPRYGPGGYGLSGALRTTNFAFTFSQGHLHTIDRMDMLRGRNYRPQLDDLSRERSLVDSNGAYQLATQWLTSVSVDVVALERSCAPDIVQRSYYTHPYPPDRTPPTNAPRRLLPVFDIEWHYRVPPSQFTGTVSMAVLGHTKQLLSLRLDTFGFSTERPLAVSNLADFYTLPLPQTNASSKVSPSPWRRPRWAPPVDLPVEQRQAWLEKFFARDGSLEPLKSPDRVEARLLKDYDAMRVMALADFRAKRGPVRVKPDQARRLAERVLEFKSYCWEADIFAPQYRIQLKYLKGTNAVDVLVNDQRDTLQLFVNGQGGPDLSCYAIHPQFVEITKALFPRVRFEEPP